MYSLDITLKEFVSQITCCLQGDNLRKILDAALTGQSEIIAILNCQQFPIGILNCHSLLCVLAKYCGDRVPASIKYDRPQDCQPVIPPIIELNTLIQPVTTLSSQITLQEFLGYFKNESAFYR